MQDVINRHVGPLYHSIPEYNFDLVNNPPFYMGVIDYIIGRVPGLMIKKVHTQLGDSYAFYYRGGNTFSGTTDSAGGNAPSIYINDAHASLEDVQGLNINEVALISYMPPPVSFVPFNGGNSGALMVYLKDAADDRANFVSSEKFDHYSFHGYTVAREFSSPDYSIPQNRSAKDNRTTLYWNPSLDTKADGKAGFSFYNSDITKGYVVIIQGMDSEGHLGYLYKVIH